MSADFQLIQQRTIFLLEPLTDHARAWVEEHVRADATRFGPAIVVERRDIADILTGIRLAGLAVERDQAMTDREWSAWWHDRNNWPRCDTCQRQFLRDPENPTMTTCYECKPKFDGHAAGGQ
jgi:hypothetical protein